MPLLPPYITFPLFCSSRGLIMMWRPFLRERWWRRLSRGTVCWWRARTRNMWHKLADLDPKMSTHKKQNKKQTKFLQNQTNKQTNKHVFHVRVILKIKSKNTLHTQMSTHGKYSPGKLARITTAAGLRVTRAWMPNNEHWIWQESVMAVAASGLTSRLWFAFFGDLFLL